MLALPVIEQLLHRRHFITGQSLQREVLCVKWIFPLLRFTKFQLVEVLDERAGQETIRRRRPAIHDSHKVALKRKEHFKDCLLKISISKKTYILEQIRKPLFDILRLKEVFFI